MESPITDEELINKILAEQDLLTLHFYNIYGSDKACSVCETYTYSKRKEIMYSDLHDIAISSPQILKNLTMKNLCALLAGEINQEKQEQIAKEIGQRLKTEKFSCINMSTDYFLKSFFSNSGLCNNLGKDNIEVIKKQILERIAKAKGNNCDKILSKITLLLDAASFLDAYENAGFSQEAISTIEAMNENNPKSMQNVNYQLFQKGIFEKIPKEYLLNLAKFPTASAKIIILNKVNPALFEILCRKIHESQNPRDNQIKIITLLDYFIKNSFKIDLPHCKEEDLINASLLECKKNQFGDIISIPPQEKYKEKMEQIYKDEYANSNTLTAKKNVYLNKFFSMSYKEAEIFLKEYGSDISNYISPNFMAQVQAIRDLLNENDPSKIDEKFYSNDNERISAENIADMKEQLAKEYALSYTEELEKTNEQINKATETQVLYKGKNIKVINSPNNFNFLVHSTDSNFVKNVSIGENADFKEIWANWGCSENHTISMSYINQDFLGLAPIGENGVLYGFTSIEADKIRVMGNTDINTYSNSFAYQSASRKYLSAQTMPYASRRVYNEIGTEREGTLPDCVIVFDDSSNQVKDNSFKAASQFGIPIVVIDKREVERQQIENLDMLTKKFEKDRNPDTFKELISTYETNVAGWLLNRSKKEEDKTHTKQIDNSRFAPDFEEAWNKISLSFEHYLSDATESKYDVLDLASIMHIVLSERDLYEGSEETKPITKTTQSYDSKEMIESINNVFAQLGDNKYEVDTAHIPTANQYSLHMENIIRNALASGITKGDTDDAERYMNLSNPEHMKIHE